MYITNLEETVSALRSRLRDYLVIKNGIRTNARKFQCFVHEDNDPSMNFNPKTNDETVKCFSCGWHGDIFAAAAVLEGLPSSGSDWLRVTIPSLCETLGIDVKLGEPSIADREKAKLRKLLQDTKDILAVDSINNEYLVERNWQQDYMPGYSIDEDVLISKLVEKGWSSEDIVSSGAIRTRYLSLFSEQNVTFVINDAYGKPIGFVTRPINPNGRAKYINSPESSLYSKSEALLGLDVALKEGDAKNAGVYIVEGPGDLAQLYRIGVKNAVAICGTALTQKHLILLKSVGVRKVYLNFDWDNAGTIATQRVLENVIGGTSGMSVFVVSAPDDLEVTDPDEFLKEVHEADPETYLSLEKKTAFEWQLSQTSENDSPDAICQRMIPSIAAEEAAIRRELLINVLQEFTGISRQAILTDVNALRDDSFNKRKEQLTAAAEMYVESVREDPENIQAHVSSHEAKIHNIEKEFRKHSVGINYQLSRYEATQERRMSSTQDVNMSTFKMNHHSDFAQAMSGGMPWTTGCLMYVGGRANSGKTASVLSVGCDISLSDENAIVIIHATDDSYEQIEPRLKTNVFRMISQRNEKLTIGMVVQPHVQLPSASKVYHDMYEEANNIMKQLIADERLVVIDSEDGNTLSVLEKNLRYYRQRYPGKKIMLICDNTHNYMDFITMDQSTRMTFISNQQKLLTVKYQCCMIATAEYRKNMPMDSSKMKLPVDDDLADARALMYRPNVIFHVYNDLHDRKEHAEIFWKDDEGTAMPRLMWNFTKNKISGFKDKLIVDLDPATVSLSPKRSSDALREAEAFIDMKESGTVKMQGHNLVYLEATEYEAG